MVCRKSAIIIHAFFFIRTNFIRTPRLRFAQKLKTKNNHQAEILILYTDWDVHLLLELARSSGAGRVINKFVTFAECVLTVSCFSHTGG